MDKEKYIFSSFGGVQHGRAGVSQRGTLSCFPSCRDEFNIQILHAFVELHEFTDLNLVQALR